MDTEYELKRLEGIISNDIASFVEMRHDLFVVFKQAIKDETDRVKNNFSQATFRLEKKRKLKRYIRFHQQALIRLEGYLLNYTNPDRITHTTEELDKGTLCQYLYFCLEELLSFVGSHFSEYFDQDMWIPESYRLIIVHQIKRNFTTLESGLLKKSIDNELVSYALQPLSEFLDSSSSNEITYRKVIYLKELQRSIIDFIHSATEDPKVSLQWLLFQHNFNPASYFQYYTEQINNHINEVEDHSERLDRLSLIQKLIHQKPVRPGYSYDVNLLSLRDQLSDWIAQEIEYLQTRSQRLAEPVDHVKPDSVNNFKIKTELSVAQLAYLLRVFVEIKIIQSQSVTSLLRFIPNFFQTKRTEHVGFSSLQARYYKPESNTKKAIRDLLLRMVKYIEKSEPLT